MCNQRNMQQIYRPRAQEENKEVIWAGREDGNTINATQLSMRAKEDGKHDKCHPIEYACIDICSTGELFGR